MKKKILLALLFAALPDSTYAASDKSHDYMVLGAGNTSCGSWATDRKEEGPGALIDESWGQGFLTALNRYAVGTNDITAGTDSNGAFSWVDNYCAQHPLEAIASAVEALVSELNRKRD